MIGAGRGGSGTTWMAVVAVLGGAVAVAQLLGLALDGAPVPVGIVLQAAVLALPQALAAVAMVLVFRSTGVVNFAGPAIGGAAAVLATVAANVWDWWFGAAVALAVAAAALVGAVVEVAFVRRFVRSSRLVITVVTLAVAQLLAAAAVFLPGLAIPASQKILDPGGERVVSPATFNPPVTPFSGTTAQVGPAVLSADHLVLALASLATGGALWWVARRTRLGLAARAVAGDRERALLSGVPAGNVTTAVWAGAAAIGALGSVVALPITGLRVDTAALGDVGSAAGPGVIVLTLAAALVGGLERPALAAAGAVALGVVRQGILWSTGRPELATVVTVVAVLVLLATARARPRGRSGPVEADGWFAADAVRPVPPVLAVLPEVRRAARRACGVVAGAAVAAAFLASPSQLDTLTTYVILGVVLASLVVLTGWAGQVSLGALAPAAVGAVATGWTARWGTPIPVALVLGAVAAGLVGLALGPILLRLRGPFLAVGSLALGVLVAEWVLVAPVATTLLPGPVGRPAVGGFSFDDGRAWYLACGAVLGALLVAAQAFRGTRLGCALIAGRDNEGAAEALGVEVLRLRIGAFAAASAIAGLGGGLLAVHQGGIRPEAFSASAGVSLFLMAVIGGLGSVPGALLGAAWFAAIDLSLSGIGARLLASGAFVLALVLYFPAGLAGGVLAGRDLWLRQVAERLGLNIPAIGARGASAAGREPAALAPARTAVADVVPRDYRLPSRARIAGTSQPAGGHRP